MKQHVLIKKVKACIEKYDMIKEGDCVLAAVSGGADSISLLYVLNFLKENIGFSIVAVHFNHKIRGKEAEEDANFVKCEAKRLGLRCIIKEANVKNYSKNMKLSLQEAGRELRYNFFFKEAKEMFANKIAVGHTLDDQAETILMRFIRGAGMRGMTGIPFVRGKIIRPLIEISREEVESFLSVNNIKWIEDPSNSKLDYHRNRIRSELLPVIKKGYNPNIINTLNKLGNILTAEETFLSHYCDDIFNNVLLDKKENYLIIDAHKLKKDYIAIQRRVVRKCIKFLKGDTKRISYVHIDDIIKMLNKQASGKYIMLPGSIFVKYENEKLFFTNRLYEGRCVERYDNILHIPGNTVVDQIQMKFTAEIWNVKHFNCPSPFPTSNRYTAFFDLQKTGEILKIRQRLPGDRFFPFGMKGEKKIKDYFIDEKISKDKRDSIPLLVSEKGCIVWIVGMRISEDVKIDKATKEILKITVTNI